MAQARELVGPERLIGLSTHDPDQIDARCDSASTTSASGPSMRPRPSRDVPRSDSSSSATRPSHAGSLPFFAIGGIAAENIDSVLAAGATRVAVVRALTESGDPQRGRTGAVRRDRGRPGGGARWVSVAASGGAERSRRRRRGPSARLPRPSLRPLPLRPLPLRPLPPRSRRVSLPGPRRPRPPSARGPPRAARRRTVVPKSAMRRCGRRSSRSRPASGRWRSRSARHHRADRRRQPDRVPARRQDRRQASRRRPESSCSRW